MQKASIKRLLIRGTNWIGDAVITEPAVTAMRELFPAARISLLVKPAVAELFTGHPACDDLLIYESRGRHAGLAGKWTLAGELRRRRFDLAILLQNAFEAAFLAWLAGIPRRYGYATDGRGWLLTDGIGVPDRAAMEHQVHYYLNLLRPLGWTGPAGHPRLFLSDDERQAMDRRLAEAGLVPSDWLIGLNPGSTYGSAKRWFPERFAETADRLAATYGGRVVIVGGPAEEALGRAIADAMQAKPIVLSGRTSVRELMAVIQRCRLFLTNDTGPMHIATAFGVPIVAVFGPTDSRTTSPLGNGHRIVRRSVECSPCLLRECPIDHRCMAGVSVDEVYQAAAEQLQAVKVEQATVDVQHPAPDFQPGPQPSILSPQPLSLQGVTVFLDRDGTINRDTGYIRTPEELELLPGVVESLARLNRAGARLVLVTNQSGIARGLLTLEALKTIHASLCARLQSRGARLDAIYYCPHHPDDACACRKPQAGMVNRAVADLGIDLLRSYVVGDQTRDVELARRIGARSVLVTTGPMSVRALALLKADDVPPDYVATAFDGAAEWIFEDVRGRHPLIVNR
ncbi:MAG: lipopolysaccharide heptosyltransferase II [Nitrospiraceae bacterium]